LEKENKILWKGGENVISSLHHPSFTVENLDRSIAFYRDLLGIPMEGVWERDPDYSEDITGIKGAQVKVAYFKLPNASFELVEYMSAPGKKIDTATNNVGSAHICFIADDFDAFIERLRSAGVTFAGKVCTIPAGSNKGKKVVYVEDPDNNSLELLSSRVLA